MDEMYAKDPWSQTDDSLVMPIRVSFMMRGLGLQLAHPISTLHYWGPIALRELAKHRQAA